MNHLITKPQLTFLFVCLFLTTAFAQSNVNLSMDSYYQEALSLHDQGDYADAESYYDITVSMEANCDKCLFNRGLVRVALEKYNKALADFNTVITINPTDIEAYEQRGHLRYLTGDIAGAISDLSAVISSSPSSTAYTNRGVAYLDQKQYPNAISDLKNGVGLDPTDGEARRTLGDAFFAINQPMDAIDQYDKAIQLNDRDILAYNNRGNAYQLIGRDEDALADYDFAIELLENSFTYTNRAKYWIKKENYEQARIDGRAASKLDFNNPEAYYCVGLVENAMANYELAAENFNKAIALDAKRADYYNGRGLALFQLKEYRDAQSDFEKALELNPADAAAKDRISDCYQKQEGNTAVVAAMQMEEEIDETEEEEADEEDEFTERGIPLVSYSAIGERIETAKKNETVVPKKEKSWMAEELEERLQIQEYNKSINKNNNITKRNQNNFQNEIQHPAGEVFTERGVNLEAHLNTLRPENSTTSSTDRALQHLDMADKHLQIRWYEQAIQQYTAALDTDASLKEAYYKRAQCYMLINDNERAIEDLNEYLLVAPKDADAFNDRGTLLFRTGNIFGALEDYNAGLRLDPSHTMLYSNRGRWHMFMGYFTKAIDDFTTAIKSEGARADIYYQRGLAHFELQQYASVISDMKAAIDKSNIKRYEYYFLSAKAQLISLQYEAALSNFNTTIELSPRFAEGYMYRAVTHRQLDMKEEACEDYNMAAGLGFSSISEEGIKRYCEE